VKRVDIYIGINPASTRKCKKRYGFVLECIINEIPHTRDWFGECEETYNGAVLRAINEALMRMNQACEIHIHTENTYILNMMENNLESWAENGFISSKGTPLENQEEWKKLWQQSVKHLLVAEAGKHPFSEWINGMLTNDEKFGERLEKQEGKR